MSRPPLAWLRPLLIAVQLLTRLPVTLQPAPTPTETGRSLAFYPVIGAGIGALLCIAACLLRRWGAAPLVSAALLSCLWIALTGALHLDGLADMADAWVGGHGDRVRTLQIMKDPRSGPVAIAAVLCVLLLKFAALGVLVLRVQPAVLSGVQSMAEIRGTLDLLWAPLLARGALPILFATTAYVREQGLGAQLARYQSRRRAIVAAVLAVLAAIYLGAGHGLACIVVMCAVFVLMRQACVSRLGGFTGDCAGAMVEVMEAAGVIALTLV
jgi:adenosylcobinamide-GDP ribazoletransferase